MFKRLPTLLPILASAGILLSACEQVQILAPRLTATSTITPSLTATYTPSPTNTLTPTLTLTTPTFGVGSTWISPKDGMVMVFVPAGELTMGNTAEKALADCLKTHTYCLLDWFKDEAPPHRVNLDSFWIDRTEVTNGMYSKCVEAGKCNPPSWSSSYTRNSYYGNSEFDDFPVVYVSWNDAKNYCDWRGDGTRLPIEAEWEKAASWDDDKKEKRVYPWGDSIDCSFANYYGQNGACVGDTTKVGSYPSGASFYDLLDMAGNVWEWVSSLYQPYPYSPSDGRENLSPSGSRVLRGSSWDDYVGNVRSANRYKFDPMNAGNYVGFRCARSQ